VPDDFVGRIEFDRFKRHVEDNVVRAQGLLEERLERIEGDIKLAKYGLGGLRWVLGIGIAAAIVAVVNGWIH
jgi:hypothetical protein